MDGGLGGKEVKGRGRSGGRGNRSSRTSWVGGGQGEGKIRGRGRSGSSGSPGGGGDLG
jgi:hypothetical protein